MKEYEQKWVEKLNETIEEKLSDPDFILSELSSIMELSPAQLYRTVVKLTGYSPKSYIRYKRMIQAKTLLERGVFSTVREVAFAVGYRHVSFFSTTYEKEFGKRPSQY